MNLPPPPRWMEQARMWACLKFPYFSKGLMRLALVPSDQVETMIVSKNWVVYANPNLFQTRCGGSIARAGVFLLHELGHPLRGHHARLARLGLSGQSANELADAEWNDDLQEAGLELWDGAILPEHLGLPRGKSLEEYARMREQEQREQEQREQEQRGEGEEGEEGEDDAQGGGEGDDKGEDDAQGGGEGDDKGEGDAQGDDKGEGDEGDAQGGGEGDDKGEGDEGDAQGGGEGERDEADDGDGKGDGKGEGDAQGDEGDAQGDGKGEGDGGGGRGESDAQDGAARGGKREGGREQNLEVEFDYSRCCGSAAGWEHPAEDPEIERQFSTSPERQELIEQQIAEAIETYAQKGIGSVPGCFLRLAKALKTRPVVDWRLHLRAALRTAVGQREGASIEAEELLSRHQGGLDRAFGRRAPRVPGELSRTPEVVVLIDTSGSMGAALLSACASEVEGIVRAVSGRLTVLATDTVVQGVIRTDNWKAAAALLKGGGGTNFAAAFAHIEQLRPRPEVLILLTDGMVDGLPPFQPRGMKVIWALIGPYASQPPCRWGLRVRIQG